MKKKILRNLKVLEQQKLVSAKNDYQEIVNAIAKVTTSILTLNHFREKGLCVSYKLNFV